jgi:membrane protein implicated in regulation of membrane protease activity
MLKAEHMGTILDVTNYLWILWLTIVLIAVVVELLTHEFTFLMVGAGSLIGGLGTNLLGAPWWMQVSAAAVATGLLLFTIRPLLLRTVAKNDELIPTNVDALKNMEGTVVSFTEGQGSVKLRNGETWTARSETNHVFNVGDKIVVSRVEGATVVVKLFTS